MAVLDRGFGGGRDPPAEAVNWGMEADFVSFLARNRCNPPVTQAQFQAWASTLGLPLVAYNNRAWLTRIPDVETQLIFGGSPGPMRGDR